MAAPASSSSAIKLPKTKYVLLSIPAPHVLLVTINLAHKMNALPVDACWEMNEVWDFLDAEPELRVGVLTGAGEKAFSSGMDLKERIELQASGLSRNDFMRYHMYPSTGFGGLTRRVGQKPVLSAVNGHAQGGGFELALNSDLVVAASHATFRLPDVMRGTAALQGAFPRLVRTVGMQRASLIGLAAYPVTAAEAEKWGLVAKVVEGGAEEVVKETLKLASQIASMSPDSVIVTRQGLREAWEEASVERATQNTDRAWSAKLMTGKNAQEGMTAFVEKREPVWKPSKL